MWRKLEMYARIVACGDQLTLPTPGGHRRENMYVYLNQTGEKLHSNNATLIVPPAGLEPGLGLQIQSQTLSPLDHRRQLNPIVVSFFSIL